MNTEMADYSQGQNLFPVLCAWCEKEGKTTVLNWIGVRGSHGICERHRAELLEEAAAIAKHGQGKIVRATRAAERSCTI